MSEIKIYKESDNMELSVQGLAVHYITELQEHAFLPSFLLKYYLQGFIKWLMY